MKPTDQELRRTKRIAMVLKKYEINSKRFQRNYK